MQTFWRLFEAEQYDGAAHLGRIWIPFIAGSLEAAYSLNWGAREIWGKGGGETLALL